MKVLLTGGTGYIGSHTAVELLQNGFEVIIIDNLSNSKIQVLDAIKKITGKKPKFQLVDLRFKSDILDFLLENKDIDAVIHFAAYKFISESFEIPLQYYENNVNGTINLLASLIKLNKEIKFIFSSSCTVYGIPDRLPVTEDMPLKEPTSPYGKTKLMMEFAIQDFVNRYTNIKAISLRYFNPIGAHHSGLIGESPLRTYNILPILVEVANGKREKFYIFGNDYPTKDGTAIRDYIHIEDLAKAHLLALKRLLDGKNEKNYEAFNIGIGKGYSVLEIVKTFEKVSGRKINYEFAPRRKGDIPEIYANADLAKKKLGWNPKYELEDMLRSAWLWELNKKF